MGVTSRRGLAGCWQTNTEGRKDRGGFTLRAPRMVDIYVNQFSATSPGY
jgi:hypothetical protein